MFDPQALRTRLRDVAALPLAIVGVAAFITVLDNWALWQALFRAAAPVGRGVVIGSMFAVVLAPLVVVLALVPGTRGTKGAAQALLVIAAVCGFFSTQYGIVIDPAMIRNIVETEVREASPLITSSFLMHVLAFGVMPALALARLPLGRRSWRAGLAVRAALIGIALAALGATVYANYGVLTYFGAEHRQLRLLMNPVYPLYAAARFVTREDDTPPASRAPVDARLAAPAPEARPKLVVLVVGETARADRFSLNGYERDTNRYTRGRGIVTFGSAPACGTSTAESVPCLFSNLGRAGFTHARAAARESLFGMLARLGVAVFWRDNSTGCKHVCDPEHFEELAAQTDPELCDATGCVDEILLKDFDELFTDTERDHFVVLHQRGSHGPAYHADTPAWAKTFLPECDAADLRDCTLEAINNAYDNTILYTDYFLARVIDLLEAREHDYDVAMLYVSDHGESLGENGLYLHGLPYSLAPREQTEVPILFWAPPSFYVARGADPECTRTGAAREWSHDSVFSTVEGLFGVTGASYDPGLDILAACHGASAAALGEAR